MNSGKSCAEITLVREDSNNSMVGLARPTLDLYLEDAHDTTHFWGLWSSTGHAFNDEDSSPWMRMQTFGAGDVMRLLLDSDAGTLTVKKNGTLLGTPVTEGLTGDLCWAVICGGTGKQVRIKAVDPEDF